MEIEQLVARESIRDLVARYNANGDSGRYEQVLGLFTPDAVLEADDVVHAGHDAIRGMFAAAGAAFTGAGPLRHFTATHQIDVTGPDTATGRAYFAVVMAHGLDHWGRYLDDYVRRDGRWRIARRRVLVDGAAEGGWAASRPRPRP